MQYNIFLRQLKRSKKTIFYLLLLLVATAFFVGSVNLYQNSVKNLQKAEETYSTLALMELHGEVDRYGQLTEKDSAAHIGNKAVAVAGYDFSEIVNSDSVLSWDLRKQYGAYIEGQPAMMDEGLPRTWGRFIRFQLKADKPVDLPYGTEFLESPLLLNLEVIDDAANCFQNTSSFEFSCFEMTSDEWASYSEQIQRVNRSEVTDKITLYPDVEYVVCTPANAIWTWSTTPGVLEVARDGSWSPSIRFDPSFSWHDCRNFRVTYDRSAERWEYENGFQSGVPFPIQRWEDVQQDPQLKAYYEKAWEDSRIQQYVHNVQLTNDISSVPAYHIGGASLKEGRLITEEEYQSGAKVCMVSDELAKYQAWKLGDKLHMKLFESDYLPERSTFNTQPVWNSGSNEFCHEGTYEIVGIYQKNPVNGNSGISPNTLDMSFFNIYIPEQSVPVQKTLEETTVHGSLFSIKLKNGSIDQFLRDMETKGLTTEKEGQYTPSFSFYDQGYSAVQPGLQSMNGTAKLLLALSTALLLIVCVLLAYFFWQSQKQTVGVYRLLGGSKRTAVRAILLCTLLLCILGSVLGGLLGYGVSEVVGERIVEANFAEHEIDRITQVYVLDPSQENLLGKVEADLLLTIVSCGAVLLFPLLTFAFMVQDIHKEPRELLPKTKV